MCYTPERLYLIRRLRTARRIYKSAPLFALVELQTLFPGYSQADLLSDLRRRTKPKVKERRPGVETLRLALLKRAWEQFRAGCDAAGARVAVHLRLLSKPVRIGIVANPWNDYPSVTFPRLASPYQVEQALQMKGRAMFDFVISLHGYGK